MVKKKKGFDLDEYVSGTSALTKEEADYIKQDINKVYEAVAKEVAKLHSSSKSSEEKKKKILFVCNQGAHRSPTAAFLWNELYGDETMSMGVFNPVHDHEKFLEWAERVIVMEDLQRKWIADNYPKEYIRLDPITLEISDIYGYMKPDLIEILKKKFASIKKEIR